MADFASLPDQDGVSVPIIAGSVEWAYLGATTKVSGGSIDFFRRPLTPGDPPTIGYLFGFSAEGTEYLFRGEKRLTNGPGFDAANALSTVHASVENPAGAVASGVLSCQLDELLRAYEGVLIEGQNVVEGVSSGSIALS